MDWLVRNTKPVLLVLVIAVLTISLGLIIFGRSILVFWKVASEYRRLSKLPCVETMPSENLPIVEDATRVDTSLITGDPCEPPCWQGLVPALSTESEVRETLATLPHVDTLSIRRLPHEDGSVDIIWDSSISYQQYADGSTQRTDGAIGLSDGTVSYISIPLEFELSVQELVDLFGEPDGYFVYEYRDPHHPQCFDYQLDIVWLDDGVVAGMHFRQEEPLPAGQSVLAPDLLVVGTVGYFNPGSDLLVYMRSRGTSGDEARHNVECCYQEWRGISEITMP